ncbi:MAG: hypothetical protein F4X77_16195 [Acidobacteriia bacterium]|nr:hypothetical protein [Terriglobia bacterium]
MIRARTIALAALLAAPAAGQDNEPTGLELFQLFSDCRPVALFVSSEGAEYGLPEESVRLVAESRLRAARLYADSPDSSAGSLYVQVSALNNSFSVSVSYMKFVTDRLGLNGPAITWISPGFGAHGGDGDYIKSTLYDHLDKFLNEYLRVNADACGGPSP